MKAIVISGYGPPEALQLKEIDKPVVRDDDVLVRVRAAAVNPYDWHLMRGEPRVARLMGIGLRRPRSSFAGADMAGQVEAVGGNVTRFRAGDDVYGMVSHGAFAEYVCVPADVLVPKPPNLTFEQAAAVPIAGMSALLALRDLGQVKPGQQVLINGASGGVGTFAVQIAKALGAGVTGVCSGRNADLVSSLGADHVIDYTREDFTRGGQRYDLMLDNIGNHPLSACRRVLTPQGTYVAVGGSGGRWLGAAAHMFKVPMVSPFVSQRMLMVDLIRHKKYQEMLVALNEFLGAGKVTPVIDRSYRLSEVPAAIRYLEEGRVPGKVVITI